MKGQLGIETIIAFTILTFFLVMITAYYASQNKHISTTGNYLDAGNVCFDLKNAIDSVSVNNMTINYTLPEMMGQRNYSAYVESGNRVVRIAWGESSYTCPIFSTVTNTTHDSFEVGKGLNAFSNRNGLIIIQKG